MGIRDDHRPMSEKDFLRIHELRAKNISWPRVGYYLGRKGENCRKRYAAWKGEQPALPVLAIEDPEIPEGDGRHVTALLMGGGFGRLPLPWNEPKLFVWRAA